MEEQLKKLKQRIPEITDTAQDTLLKQLLEDAEQEILDFTNRTELLPKMLGLQRDLALRYYNRQGLEGVSSQSQGKMSTSYSIEIPEDLKQRLIEYRRLKVVGYANNRT